MEGKATSPELLDHSIKAATVFVGCLYAIGLLTSTARLAQFGILNVELAKPIYVLTGAWACLPFGIASAAAISFNPLLHYFTSDKPSRYSVTRLFGATAVSAIGALIAMSVLLCLAIIAVGFASPYLNVGGFDVGFRGTLTKYSLFALLIIGTVRLFKPRPRILSPSLTLIQAGYAATLGVVYIFVFSAFLYPRIPAQLGGGGVRLFRLVIDDPLVRGAITETAVNKSSVWARVLAETTDSYIIERHEPYFKGDRLPSKGGLHWTPLYGDETSEVEFVVIPKAAVKVASISHYIARINPSKSESSADQN